MIVTARRQHHQHQFDRQHERAGLRQPGVQRQQGGINQLTCELAVEWARFGVRVNALLPRQFSTPAVQLLWKAIDSIPRAVLAAYLGVVFD